MSEAQDSGTQPIEEAAIAADTPTTSETAETTTTAPNEPEANTKPDEPKRRPWFEKVIADKAHEAREYRRQAEALQAQLQSMQRPAQQPQTNQAPAGLINEADVERLVEQRATAREFTDACNSTYEAGVAKYADFDDAVKTYSLLGGPPPAFQCRPARHPHRGTILGTLDGSLGRREYAQTAQRVQSRVQGHPQAARLDHPAESLLADIGSIEVQEQR